MKKYIAMLLTLIMCISVTACGGGKVKAEDLAGTWSQSLWFLPTELVINDDSTYDYGEEKGTYTLSGNTVVLEPRFGDRTDAAYKYFNGYLYCTTRSFAKDMEYGRPFTPDENGRTNQEFIVNLGDGLEFDPAAVANSIEFKLNDDGTFYIFTSVFRYSSSLGYYFNDKPFNTYEGTYKYQDSVLTLTYEGNDYPLVVEDGVIYYMTYSK